MRHLRMALALGVATCAFVVMATPALAHEFVSSKAGKTHGTEESEQTFKFGVFKITCQKAVAKGAVAEGTSSTYATSIKFAKCLTSAKIGSHEIFLPTRFLSPLAIEYHANGFVETGSELEETEGGAAKIAGGSAELKVKTGRTAENEKSECNISWEEQTIPLRAVKNPEGEYSAATYLPEAIGHTTSKVFPDGKQHYIEISNEFKGIHYTLEGEPCEEWGREEGSEGVQGRYTGSFPQFLGGGNLTFQ
jgi:hypothetical protein